MKDILPYLRSVARVAAPIVVGIFIAEFLVMMLLFWNVPLAERLWHAGVDSVLLVLVVYPFLHHLLIERRKTIENRQQYVHTISHDLRSPLHVIGLRADQLKRALSGGGPAKEAHADAILTSVKRLDAMIEDLVDSARAESGQLVLNKQRLELKTFTLELLERLGGVLEVNRVKVESPPEAIGVLADAARLERIVINLVTNALRYSPPSSEVTVQLRRLGGESQVVVSNQGEGIAREDLPHVFDRAFRTQAGSSSGGGGLGLGLKIVRMLAEAHGGKVWAESEPGAGTRFTLSLPGAE